MTDKPDAVITLSIVVPAGEGLARVESFIDSLIARGWAVHNSGPHSYILHMRPSPKGTPTSE